jgi:hypothetical protein
MYGIINEDCSQEESENTVMRALSVVWAATDSRGFSMPTAARRQEGILEFLVCDPPRLSKEREWP